MANLDQLKSNMEKAAAGLKGRLSAAAKKAALAAFEKAEAAYTSAMTSEPEAVPVRKLGRAEQRIADILGARWGGTKGQTGGWRHRIQGAVRELGAMAGGDCPEHMSEALLIKGWANRFMGGLLALARALDEGSKAKKKAVPKK